MCYWSSGWVLKVHETQRNLKTSAELDIQKPNFSTLHVWFHSVMSDSKNLQSRRRTCLMKNSSWQLHQKPCCLKRTDSAIYFVYRERQTRFIQLNAFWNKSTVFFDISESSQTVEASNRSEASRCSNLFFSTNTLLSFFFKVSLEGFTFVMEISIEESCFWSLKLKSASPRDSKESCYLLFVFIFLFQNRLMVIYMLDFIRQALNRKHHFFVVGFISWFLHSDPCIETLMAQKFSRVVIVLVIF